MQFSRPKTYKITKNSNFYKKWPNSFFHGQGTSKLAKCFEIGHKKPNLETVVSSPVIQPATPLQNVLFRVFLSA